MYIHVCMYRHESLAGCVFQLWSISKHQQNPCRAHTTKLMLSQTHTHARTEVCGLFAAHSGNGTCAQPSCRKYIRLHCIHQWLARHSSHITRRTLLSTRHSLLAATWRLPLADSYLCKLPLVTWHRRFSLLHA